MSHVRLWTLQELLALSIFYCLAAAVALLLTKYWFRQEATNLIYSLLPADYKTQLWFGVCFVQETNQMLYCLFSASFLFQLHLLLPGTLSRVLKTMAESVISSDENRPTLYNIIRQIRVVQLVVNLFNVGHRNITYCIKLVCITVSIVNGYGVVAHGGEDVVFLLLAFSITCDLVFFYAFVYEKAFAIPDGVDRVKRELTIRRMKNATVERTVRKQLKSIPSFELKVGDFHMLERESTPMFVDYVLKNIVNLLVTLR